MGYTTTTYDRTIYRAVYKPNGVAIYILVQVDKISLACYNQYVAEDIYIKIGGTVQFPGE